MSRYIHSYLLFVLTYHKYLIFVTASHTVTPCSHKDKKICNTHFPPLSDLSEQSFGILSVTYLLSLWGQGAAVPFILEC